MTSSKLAVTYTGDRAPANPGDNVLWRSKSMRHIRPPAEPERRYPIIGSTFSSQSATQECNPYWNPLLKRWEAITNRNSLQLHHYSDTPDGPWTAGVTVIGGGVGGEASTSTHQCDVTVENGVLYAFYSAGSGAQTLLQMASAPMPTDPAVPPVFTKRGVVATSTLSATGSSCVVKNADTGLYYLFWERSDQSTISLSTSAAATLADLINTPFVEVQQRLQYRMNFGARTSQGGGRPQVFYEDGLWIMFHHGGGLELGMCGIHRSTCTDVELPINWVTAQEDIWFMRQKHQLEIDQAVDFRVAKDEWGTWWGFSTAADNSPSSFAFTILAYPMIHPLCAYSNGIWAPVEALPAQASEQDWINPDRINSATALQNLWDCWCNSAAASYALTLPTAASHSRSRIHNDPSNTGGLANQPQQGNPLTVILKDPTREVLIGRNPITAITASGTTVTVTTKRPHGLVLTDLVTLTGHLPAAYNAANVVVTGVPSATQFTYTSASAPAANTKIGFYDRTSIEVGETFEYRCSTQYGWVRV